MLAEEWNAVWDSCLVAGAADLEPRRAETLAVLGLETDSKGGDWARDRGKLRLAEQFILNWVAAALEYG